MGSCKMSLKLRAAVTIARGMNESTHAPTPLPPMPCDPPAAVPGVLDEQTMSHLLDVELARARRYQHPFAIVAVSTGGDAAAWRRVAGALRFHTRWADSVGAFGGALLVILRDTQPDGARVAGEKIAASLAGELAGVHDGPLRLEIACWRKGDDRLGLLGRTALLKRDAGG